MATTWSDSSSSPDGPRPSPRWAAHRGRRHHLRLFPVRLRHRTRHGQGHPGRPLVSVAVKGFQLVYGATANLFIDRHGEYIGYGPEAAELVGLPDVDTFCPLPWDRSVARVFCTLFRGREETVDGGAYLTSDCRGNLRRLHEPSSRRRRPAPARRLRARDDVAQDESRRHALGGCHQAVLLPHRPVPRTPAGHPQGDRVLGAWAST